jgi:hypothetical protein
MTSYDKAVGAAMAFSLLASILLPVLHANNTAVNKTNNIEACFFITIKSIH